MTELFEVIGKDEFDAETSVTPEPRGDILVFQSRRPEDAGVTGVYCEFCKGYYNEYHYGREVDNDH